MAAVAVIPEHQAQALEAEQADNMDPVNKFAKGKKLYILICHFDF